MAITRQNAYLERGLPITGCDNLNGMAPLVIDNELASRELLTTMLQELGVNNIPRVSSGR